MSFITVQHQNPGAVTKRMNHWSNVERNDLVMRTINDKLNELYKIVYKASPYKTGYLRSTIKVSSGDGFAQIAVTAYYARFVEKGTKRNTAQPFFFPNVVAFNIDIIVAVRNVYAMAGALPG